MRRLAALILLVSVLCPAAAHPKTLHRERFYQASWCSGRGGTMEVTLPDRTRIDCLTSAHAIEVDFAPKWAEAIGQALYYGASTGKRPGVLLIMEKPGDRRYLERLRLAVKRFGLPLKVWVVSPADIEKSGPR